MGQTLAASDIFFADADGLSSSTFAYQWLADDTEISGATSATYTIVDSDEGKTIKVRVTFTDDSGSVESLTSEATGTVSAFYLSRNHLGRLRRERHHDGGHIRGDRCGRRRHHNLVDNRRRQRRLLHEQYTGALTFSSPPDYESPSDSGTDNVYQVTINASDGTNNGILDVTVSDVNDGPAMTLN